MNALKQTAQLSFTHPVSTKNAGPPPLIICLFPLLKYKLLLDVARAPSKFHVDDARITERFTVGRYLFTVAAYI